MSKLFVGGLSWNTTESSLREGFEKFGEVKEAKIVMDRDTGKSRGFGFVTFSKKEDANDAIGEMDGMEFDGRRITVNEAKERPRRSY